MPAPSTARAHAVRVHEFGDLDALRYEPIDRPVPGAGEVRVRVHAAGVNPVDVAVRQGYLRKLAPPPVIPGGDIAGVVDVLGPDVVDPALGASVYGMIGLVGGYTEYAVAPAARLARMPRTLDFVRAAAVPIVALTAWQMLFEEGQLRHGQRVLVHAAAGGVGSFAVQFAKHVGAEVIGTASAANADYLRELGADRTIDYHSTRFEEVVREVDLVIDLVGGETQERSWAVLKPGGTLVTSVSGPSAERAEAAGAVGKHVSVRPDREQLRQIAELIDAGHVRVEVSAVFPLADARGAQQAIATRHTRGKIVLDTAG